MSTVASVPLTTAGAAVTRSRTIVTSMAIGREAVAAGLHPLVPPRLPWP